jgi:xanthine dehydrogenase iron-sulfur cluster and FAD-binding subunit A
VRAAQQALAREIAPIDDMRSTAHYRLRVAQNLLAEFCQSIAA